MSDREYDLVASSLESAKYAFMQQSCYGQVIDLRLRHKDLPNGYPAPVRVAVGPDMIVCRVTHTGRDHRTFGVTAKPLLDFATTQMRGWTASPNSCGTGGGKIFWKERQYRPHRIEPVNLNYADLLQAVTSARSACVARTRFKRHGTERWQSPYTDNGIYTVAWTVEAEDTAVVIHIKNKGRNEEAFDHLIDWTFDYIKKHNPDGRDLNAQPRGIIFKTFSQTLRLEVPCR